jgi:hypothetical protein
VNYSELYHPYSHHNVAIGNDKPLIVPSDLEEAQNQLQFVQKGFYSNETLTLINKYAPQTQNLLQKTDPRMNTQENFFRDGNQTVKMNSALMDEIYQNQKLRA